MKRNEVAQSCPTLCNPMDYSLAGSSIHGIFPGKNIGVGCHFLLQEIFLTLELNLGLLHCRLYHLSHRGRFWKKRYDQSRQHFKKQQILLYFGNKGPSSQSYVLSAVTTERLHFHFTFMHWRRKWQPTPVSLPGESQGWGSLVGCHLLGRTE